MNQVDLLTNFLDAQKPIIDLLGINIIMNFDHLNGLLEKLGRDGHDLSWLLFLRLTAGLEGILTILFLIFLCRLVKVECELWLSIFCLHILEQALGWLLRFTEGKVEPLV